MSSGRSRRGGGGGGGGHRDSAPTRYSSIASQPPHPSRPFVRPKISVSTVKHRLFVKTTFHQQPSVTTTITTTPSPLLLLPTTIHWQPVQAVQPRPTSLDTTTFQHHLTLPASAQQ
ncbi:hypothetical protein ANN_20483 [Periplaneta americana]|uniref:Uncharacterized protein n=1 Tax=Periplaneta americana TaxID=6978 RepID=A0ABQ8SCP9_PERAM|nr:hypothetical protein ANN_20483 [Periplaneta americana]